MAFRIVGISLIPASTFLAADDLSSWIYLSHLLQIIYIDLPIWNLVTSMPSLWHHSLLLLFFPIYCTPLFPVPGYELKFFPDQFQGWHGSNSFRWRGANHGSEAQVLMEPISLSSSSACHMDELCTGISDPLRYCGCVARSARSKTAWPAPTSACSESMCISPFPPEWIHLWGGFKPVGKRCGPSPVWHERCCKEGL